MRYSSVIQDMNRGRVHRFLDRSELLDKKLKICRAKDIKMEIFRIQKESADAKNDCTFNDTEEPKIEDAKLVPMVCISMHTLSIQRPSRP
jgi:hypothetical protein